MNSDNRELTIDISQTASLLIGRAWIIVISALLCAILCVTVTLCFVSPRYEADIKVYVNNNSLSSAAAGFSISSSDISAAQSLVDTYVVILNSRSTLEELISQTGVQYSCDELSDMISAGSINGTEIFKVTVTSTDPNEAARIANAIALILPAKIADTVLNSSVRIVDYAQVPAESSSPSLIKNAVIAFALGLILACLAVIIADMLDSSIRSADYLTETFPDIPLLTVIPDTASGRAYGYKLGYSYYGGDRR